MIGSPGDMTLAVNIVTKYQSEQLQKAQKDLNTFKEATKSSGVELKKANVSASDFRNAIRSLGMVAGGEVRQITGMSSAFLRFGSTAGVAISSVAVALVAMSKSSADATRALSEMHTSAIELGVDFETFQRWKTGISFSEQDLKNLQQVSTAWGKLGQFFKNMWTSLGVGVGGILSKVLPKAAQEIDTLGKSAEDTLKRINEETKRLTLSQGQFREYAFTKQYRQNWDTLQLGQDMSPDQMNMRQKYLDEWERANVEALTRAKWGFKGFYDEMEDLQKAWAQHTSSLFADVLIDGLDNKFRNARQIAYSFFKDLRDMLIKAMMNQMIASLLTKFLPVSSPTPAIDLGTLTIFGGGKTGGSGGGGGFQQGGWVGKHGPERVLVGEKEPELIVPLSKMANGNGGGGDTYYIINAIDTESFAQALKRNGDAVTSIVQENVNRNKHLRQGLRK